MNAARELLRWCLGRKVSCRPSPTRGWRRLCDMCCWRDLSMVLWSVLQKVNRLYSCKVNNSDVKTEYPIRLI